MGNLQYTQGPVGTILKEMPGPRTRFSPGERAQQARVRRIGAAWRSLGRAEMALWRAYGESLAATTPAMERRATPAYNAFLTLAVAVLKLDPTAAIPRTPPASAFGGDAAVVTVGAYDSPSFHSCPETPSPTVPPFVPQGEPSSGLLFRSDRANAAGVATELMAQRLLSAGRTPRPTGYVSQGFVRFEAGTLEAELPCAPGWYACAVRFVRAETGQTTAIFPLELVDVGI